MTERTNDWFTEFKKAYDDYPSQDNEGFVPDRGGFKCGFGAAWKVRDAELAALRGANERMSNDPNRTALLKIIERVDRDNEFLRIERDSARADRDALLELLGDFVDVHDEPCRIDPNGNCQAHFVDWPCLVADSIVVLARIHGAAGDGVKQTERGGG